VTQEEICLSESRPLTPSSGFSLLVSSLPKLHDSDEAEHSALRRPHVREVAGSFVQVAIRPDCMLSVKVIQLATRFEEIVRIVG
jgi:hypothetical protein